MLYAGEHDLMRLILAVKLEGEADEYIERCARIRQISRKRLLQRILEVVCDDQLVLGILDDDSKPDRQLPGEATKSRFHRRRGDLPSMALT
jgi:hypothetical protein